MYRQRDRDVLRCPSIPLMYIIHVYSRGICQLMLQNMNDTNDKQ